jgi:hypothetical protein
MQYNADKHWFKSRSKQFIYKYVLSYILEMKQKLIRSFLD